MFSSCQVTTAEFLPICLVYTEHDILRYFIIIDKLHLDLE